MVLDKTGGLFRLAVGLMISFKPDEDPDKFKTLVDRLALYFQIRDDLVNLASDAYVRERNRSAESSL
jgi:geranylgeranyl diphosphate synthase type 3